MISELYLLVEVKEKLAVICSVDFDFLASVRSNHNTMMRFVMTFDDTVRGGSSFDHKFIVLNFHFYWYCLSLKANFQKKNIVEIHLLKVSWVP